MRFRTKPLEIEAIQFVENAHDETNLHEIWDFMGRPGDDKVVLRPPGALGIVTPDGLVAAEPGDWVVKDDDGAFDVYEREVFEAFFQEATAPDRIDKLVSSARGTAHDWRQGRIGDEDAIEMFGSSLIFRLCTAIDETRMSAALFKAQRDSLKEKLGAAR